MKNPARRVSEAEDWRRRSFDVQTSEVVAGRAPGPKPPRAWASQLDKFIDLSRKADAGPEWWTPVNAYFGSIETRTDPKSYYWDGMKRLRRRDHPLVFFQFTLAGFGHFEPYGRPPQRITPGMGFFALLPSEHRYYLPVESPGWTFAWIGIYHPYLLRRISSQVQRTGSVIQVTPQSPFIARLTRLVRGVFHKDFRDRFDVEQELLKFTHAFERLVQQSPDPEGAQLLEELRARVLGGPKRSIPVDTLASERGMSRTAYSHFFLSKTGLTPARFMTEVRVQDAARLLATTRLSLSQIANECGFANANHFGKVFRRFRQQSASAYRHAVG